MSRLFRICTVCLLVFEFIIWYSLDKRFWKFFRREFYCLLFDALRIIISFNSFVLLLPNISSFPPVALIARQSDSLTIIPKISALKQVLF